MRVRVRAWLSFGLDSNPKIRVKERLIEAHPRQTRRALGRLQIRPTHPSAGAPGRLLHKARPEAFGVEVTFDSPFGRWHWENNDPNTRGLYCGVKKVVLKSHWRRFLPPQVRSGQGSKGREAIGGFLVEDIAQNESRLGHLAVLNLASHSEARGAAAAIKMSLRSDSRLDSSARQASVHGQKAPLVLQNNTRNPAAHPLAPSASR